MCGGLDSSLSESLNQQYNLFASPRIVRETGTLFVFERPAWSLSLAGVLVQQVRMYGGTPQQHVAVNHAYN